MSRSVAVKSIGKGEGRAGGEGVGQFGAGVGPRQGRWEEGQVHCVADQVYERGTQQNLVALE
ncbi:hypothetical protein GCM10027569_34200 [Flindersiella endophytica]